MAANHFLACLPSCPRLQVGGGRRAGAEAVAMPVQAQCALCCCCRRCLSCPRPNPLPPLCCRRCLPACSACGWQAARRPRSSLCPPRRTRRPRSSGCGAWFGCRACTTAWASGAGQTLRPVCSAWADPPARRCACLSRGASKPDPISRPPPPAPAPTAAMRWRPGSSCLMVACASATAQRLRRPSQRQRAGGMRRWRRRSRPAALRSDGKAWRQRGPSSSAAQRWTAASWAATAATMVCTHGLKWLQ